MREPIVLVCASQGRNTMRKRNSHIPRSATCDVAGSKTLFLFLSLFARVVPGQPILGANMRGQDTA